MCVPYEPESYYVELAKPIRSVCVTGTFPRAANRGTQTQKPQRQAGMCTYTFALSNPGYMETEGVCQDFLARPPHAS